MGDDMNFRECAPCTLCCTAKGVADLGKLSGQGCEYLCQTGCVIHGCHPEACSDYHCAWSANILCESDRPDLIGAVLDIIACPKGVHPTGHMVQVSPATPGVIPPGRTRELIDTYLARDEIVLISGKEGWTGQVLYPDGVVQQFEIAIPGEETGPVTLRPYASYSHRTDG